VGKTTKSRLGFCSIFFFLIFPKTTIGNFGFLEPDNQGPYFWGDPAMDEIWGNPGDDTGWGWN
jgi:hypothetical protein